MTAKLRNCGICCSILSVWAIIQLGVMGLCFYYETFPFLEEAMEFQHVEHVTDIDKFVKTTKESYYKIAINCWCAAAMYAGTLLLSLTCIGIAKTRSKTMFSARDEDLFCSTEAEKFATIDKTVTAEKDKRKKKDKARDYVKEHEKREENEKKARLKMEKKQNKEKLEKDKKYYKAKHLEEKIKMKV